MARLALLGATLLCALAVSTQGSPEGHGAQAETISTGRRLQQGVRSPHVYNYRELGYNWANSDSPFSGGKTFMDRGGTEKEGVCNGPTGRQSPINIETSQLIQDTSARTDAGAVSLNGFANEGGYVISDISVNLEQDMQLFFNSLPDETQATKPTLPVGGETLTLSPLQLHFHHFLSEHTYDGRHFPLEAHLVLTNGGAPAGVIGVMYEYGPADPFLDTVFNAVDAAVQNQGATVGETKQPINLNLDVRRDLLPSAASAYFGYDGSLTTPPCTEGAKWHLIKETRTVSPEQMKRFMSTTLDANAAADVTNNRVIQGSNALVGTAECDGNGGRHCRPVYEYTL